MNNRLAAHNIAIRCHHQVARWCQRGFSLVEIAVVLVIVGFALGAGLAILQARTEQAQIEATRTRAEGIRQAIVAYVSRNYRMPCPAAPGIVVGAANYGIEMATGLGTARTCTAGSGLVNNVGGVAGASRGTVPCLTLGLTEEACADAWGARFTYFVSNGAIQLTQATVSSMQGTLTVHTITPPAAPTPAAGLAPTGNQVNACSATANDNACNLAAVAVIISHGANLGGGFPPRSAVATATAGVVSAYELENTNNNLQLLLNEYVKDGTNSFDDIVVAMPARDVLSTLSQNSTLRDPRALMNERFEAVKLAIIQQSYSSKGTATTITLSVDGGNTLPYVLPGTPTLDIAGCAAPSADTQALPTTTTVAALTGLTTDIWGRAIRYKRLAAGPIAASNPCVTPFFLLSYGPDGVTGGTTGSLDDILFPVSQGDLNAAIIKLGGW